MGLIPLDPHELRQEVEETGYAIVPSCLDTTTLDEMRRESAHALDVLPNYEYPFGDQCRIEAPELRRTWLSSLPVTAQILLEGPIAEVCAGYGADERKDLLVWSREFNRDTEAIYGTPHFDRRHQLKVFVYLTDVGEHNGPTHVASEDPAQFRERWIEAWRVALDLPALPAAEILEQVRSTSEDSSAYRSVACVVDRPRQEFRPLTGGAGTVVIFDTSLAHFGGLVDEVGTRHTVRRHCLLD